MLGISGWEAIVLIVLILLVLGPERLPEYAENLRDLVKRARRYASGAKEDLRETLGPEIGDLDWRKLDPRQYDPRTIVRDALLEADQEDSAEKRKREREEREAARAERKRRREEEAAAAGEDLPAQAKPFMRLGDSQQAPFDPEAT